MPDDYGDIGLTTEDDSPPTPPQYINEPGIDDFDVNNFPAILALLEDGDFGNYRLENYGLYEGSFDLDDQALKLSWDDFDLYIGQLKKFGIYDIYDHHDVFEDELQRGIISDELEPLMQKMLGTPNLLNNFEKVFPRIMMIVSAYEALVHYQLGYAKRGEVPNAFQVTENDFISAFGEGWKNAEGFANTQVLIGENFQERTNVPPAGIQPWEMRIGASRFFVPPININVAETFRVGSLSGGALRSQNSPKFNSGHSETVISMTLYFPNHESIWGYDEKGKLEINFDSGGDSDVVIDKFISSLRGLITQFKYAPFLPIRNDYLNRTYDITGVAFSSISIQTVPGFPFCIAVNLQLLKFNFKPYLPPISDFNQAVHWGRYRQYIGRAAQKMNSEMSEGFLIKDASTESDDSLVTFNSTLTGNDSIDPSDQHLHNMAPDAPIPQPSSSNSIIQYEHNPTLVFDKQKDFDDGHNFDIYYPIKTPAKIFAPDATNFRQDGEDDDIQRDKNTFELFMRQLGITVDTNYKSYYDEVQATSNNFPLPNQEVLFQQYMATFGGAVEMMTNGRLQELIDKAKESAASDVDPNLVEQDIRNRWLEFIFIGYKSTPFFQKYLASAQFAGGNYLIQEWKVPMEKVNFNWTNILVQGVSVTLSNNIVRLQLQMSKEPVHQHLGAHDSSVNVSLLIFGEDDLIKFRRVFDHINGLARLEHAHGTLGFLGIKNVLTALAGIKYVLPLSFEVDTVPNYPHVYKVNLSFVDFDIFQQKREEISSSQQTQLMEAFGKRNPFLRIKQLWGAFNAYPDLPLSVRDPDGNIVGSLNPDFYFRAYQSFDDDIKFINTRPFIQGEVDNLDKHFLYATEADNTQQAQMQRRAKAIQDQLAGDNDMPAKMRAQLNLELSQIMEYLAGVSASTDIPNAAYEGMKYYSQQVLGDKIEGYNQAVTWDVAVTNESQKIVTKVKIESARISVGETSADDVGDEVGNSRYGSPRNLTDQVPERVLKTPAIEGHTPYSSYMSAYADGSDNPTKHWELMMTDAAYRDVSGRMIRAFPTYMLWLIDEGGRFAGVKLFDNFYGLQSVIDFSVVASEDILGDTLVLRLSNLYHKLTTPYSNYLFNEQGDDPAKANPFGIIDHGIDVWRNIASGTMDNFQVPLNNIRLAPGVRLHLRMGYSANPNSLQTVFNGTITEVREGDIVEVVAQSDAIELSPFVNTTNKKGSSGKIDGAFNTGLWLSEPRDLMVRLLSMGSSTFKESIAHATNGMIFSENKFGIRHFGQIMYEPLSEGEAGKQDERYQAIKSALDQLIASNAPSMEALGAGAQGIGNPIGAVFDSAIGNAATRSPMISVMQNMWANFFRKRDYEIFKRNIYPGNGLGIAQFLGGDTLDGGVTLAASYNADVAAGAAAPSVGANNQYSNLLAQAQEVQAFDKQNEYNAGSIGVELEGKTDNTEESTLEKGVDVLETITGGPLSRVSMIKDSFTMLTQVFSGREDNPILQAMGIAKPGEQDDDLTGFDEVSFRAQTYMKSVWDLFQMCAALLPNYIVAVRPFEDRSTVFYGKPHWMYTSGLIPLSLGVSPDAGPKMEGPDSVYSTELAKLQNDVMNNANAFADFEEQNNFITSAGSVSPYSTTAGIKWAGGDVNSLPLIHSTGAEIPTRSTNICEEMHLPTSDNLRTDIDQHLQSLTLPDHKRHPLYMDRIGAGRGGEAGFNVEGQNSGLPGAHGAFGPLSPEVERWYMNMPWPYGNKDTNSFYKEGHKYDWYDPNGSTGVKKVVIYAQKTGKACVCAIGEFGPAEFVVRNGIACGASPDVMEALGIVPGDKVYLGFAPDDTALGPASGAIAPGAIATGGETEGSPTRSELHDEQLNPTFKDTILTYEGIRNIWNDSDTATEIEEDLAHQEYTYDAIHSTDFGYIDTDHNYLDNTAGAQSTEQTKNEFLDSINFTAEEFEDAYQKSMNYWGVGALNLGSISYENEIEKNRFYYAFEYGAFDKDVPVWIAPHQGDEVRPGQVDIVGITARRLYDKDYNTAFLDVDNPATWEALLSYDVSNNFLKPSGTSGSGGRTLMEAQDIWREFRDGFWDFTSTEEVVEKWAKGTLLDAEGILVPAPENVTDKQKDEVVARFMRFMWQDAYSRAWLVITTSKHNENMVQILTDAKTWDFGSSKVQQLFEYYLATMGANSAIIDQRLNPDDPEVSTGEKAADDFTAEAVTARNLLVNWEKANNTQGGDSSNPVQELFDDVQETWDQTIGQVWNAIATGLSGLTALFRASMMDLGQGLTNVNTMQQQANVLNKAFNDSIYYSAGSPGSILRLADNPFTREYGEPVVEIREPFQRMHYLSSFEHILSNNIVENLNNVPTVVTATSDGQYPVTVYFDRGAPPERQVEKVVETGLFWDNTRGSGFFGILHPLLHPIETARGIIKSATGSSDELLSKRVALYHLKEGLKDIYTGELVVLGNPDIRPHDLIYIADSYSRMYGMAEVEQVVHHFTPETGFITSITPNAIVTINDPTRWSMISWVHSWFAVKNVRDDVRLMLSQRGFNGTNFSAEGITQEELAAALEPQMMGHLQFAHGNSALIKDLASAAALGNFGLETRDQVVAEGGSSPGAGKIATELIGALPVFNVIRDVLSGPWDWVKDNLLDQHGCYIQYLNKDGQAMDAGLSYNQGVAVGRHHSITLLPGILGLKINTLDAEGHKRITSDDLLKALGWNEVDVDMLQLQTGFFTAQTNAQILNAANLSPDETPIGSVLDVHIVTVKDAYFDGDTFDFMLGSEGMPTTGKIRLAGVNAAEVSHGYTNESFNFGSQIIPVDGTYAENHIGYQASAFLRKRLITDPEAEGYQPTVAVRLVTNPETYERLAAVVFHNVPDGTPKTGIDPASGDKNMTFRDWALYQNATKIPINTWDSYMEDGKPYTINWEVIAAGYAVTSLFGDKWNPEEGVVGLGKG